MVVRGRVWTVPYPISQALLLGERVLVIYDYMAGPSHCQFRNLEAYSPNGVRLWTAEHPTSESADAYVRIVSESPLVAANFAGFACTLDPETGKLLESRFTK